MVGSGYAVHVHVSSAVVPSFEFVDSNDEIDGRIGLFTVTATLSKKSLLPIFV
jgi:hypothetical protein